jgi:Pathogenicity locus
MGFTHVEDLRGQDPEVIYEMANKLRGSIQDLCLLYTFRCAVYYADTPPEKRDPELLKWWNWKNKK